MKVVFNLLDNALRHGGDLSGISISSRFIENDLVIFVWDDGVGILDDIKPYIFDRCFGKDPGFGLFLFREILPQVFP